MKQIFFTLIVIFAITSAFTQSSLNDYKYVIVEKQFHFQSEPNQYRLNDLVKYMLKKIGFESLIEGDPIPEDLKNNFCLALRVDVSSSGLLKTRSVITLSDCNNKPIFISKEGISKDKNLDVTYNLSIRDAFKSFEKFNYKYAPKQSKTQKTKTLGQVKDKEEITKLKAEIKELKLEKETNKVVKSIKLEKPTERNDTREVAKSDAVKVTEVKNILNKNEESFKVKEIFNGYKLFDNSSNLVMTIFDSGVKDVFIVKGKDAIIYKKGDAWIYSETNETNLLTKIITIKF